MSRRRQQTGAMSGGPRRRRPRQAVLWAALIGMLFQAVVPVYAMAAAALRNPGLIPICSTSGITWVALDDGAPASPAETPGKMPGDKPCHFCFSATAPYALPAEVPGHTSFGQATDDALPIGSGPLPSGAWPGDQAIRAPPEPSSRSH